MRRIQQIRKLLFLLLLSILSLQCFSQVAEQWVRRYNAGGKDEARSLALDAQGNVYVTGTSENVNFDYNTIKYDANGNELWVRNYDGPGDRVANSDFARSIAVDAQGNVYVTGFSIGNGSGYDYATIKYDTHGNELWEQRYNANGNDEAEFIAADAQGNIYVTGSSVGSNGFEDYATIKYDTNGNQLWVRRYNGPGNNGDGANELAVDAQGNVYVTGTSTGSGTGTDYATIKYDINGNELWAKRYNGPSNASEQATSLAVDARGNVYVTGNSTGSNGEFDYATIKYDANGNQLWLRRYNAPDNRNDIAYSLAVDAKGNIYVTGGSVVYGLAEPDYDYATIKYDADGNQQWVKRYDGPWGTRDIANDLAIDAQGNVYVTGESVGRGGSEIGTIDYATIKYDSNGNQQWVKRYNGPGNDDDVANDLAVDTQGNVYVTGRSEGSGTGVDYATIKYSQLEVVSFAAIDSYRDQAIRELRNGDVVNFVALPDFTQLNIVANTSPVLVGSVVLNLSGPLTRKQIENGPPYSLFGDENGIYYWANLPSGNYTLTATPYSAINGGGVKGIPKTIQFQVVNQEVKSFTLVNADTEKDIRELKNGDVINLSSLPKWVRLNIRANTSPATVGSVELNFNGAQTSYRLENGAPYTLYGDLNGNYFGNTLRPGDYSLTAVPYNGKYGRGQKGTSKTISFSVVNTLPITQIQSSLGYNAPLEAKGNLSATPNPFITHATISFSIPQPGYTTLELIDQRGAVVERLYAAQAQVGQVYTIEYNRKQLKSGVYVLRLVSGKYVRSYNLMLIP